MAGICVILSAMFSVQDWHDAIHATPFSISNAPGRDKTMVHVIKCLSRPGGKQKRSAGPSRHPVPVPLCVAASARGGRR
ncbi:hypothetical protein SXCC_01081 [Gluconacetobacter sp. SXCC-1]|nr:hypothetical protein SXCC_01081 [Gluconacetobacter sp. SXCC-1]